MNATWTRRGLAPLREVLPNGVAVTVVRSPVTPAVSINVAVRAGSLHDPADRPGLAHLAGRVIDRGTGSRPADAISETLDEAGVALATSVSRHLVTLTCTCLSADLDAVLDVVADIVRDPVFPDEEIERRRTELLTSIEQDDDNPAVRAVQRLMELMYGGDHPYGRPARGTRTSIPLVDRHALLRHHAERFGPRTLSVVLCGDLDPVRIVDRVAARLGDWHDTGSEEPVPPAVPATEGRREIHIRMPGKAQCDIAYGFTTLTRSDPAYYACWIMNTVLGQYGLGGRLGDNIRERHGMAYYTFSSFDANVREGPLVVRAGVSPANVDRAITAIDDEVRRMAAEGVTPGELADVKRYLIGSLPRLLETHAGIASFLQNAEHFGLGLDYDQRLPGLLDAVTEDDVLAVARRVLDADRAALVVAGPHGESPIAPAS